MSKEIPISPKINPASNPAPEQDLKLRFESDLFQWHTTPLLGQWNDSPRLKGYFRENVPVTPGSVFQISRENDGYRVGFAGRDFPLALKNIRDALDLKNRMEILLTVNDTCKKIETFRRDCDFQAEKASFVVGGGAEDIVINSGPLPFFNKTIALTHERVNLIFGAKHGKEAVPMLSEYLNSVIRIREKSGEGTVNETP